MAAPAGDEAPTTGFLLWYVSVKWRVALDRALAPVGLTASQYSVLATLHALSRSGARPSQRELADFNGLEPMYVSKLARALERAGLLERASNPADPRAVQLTLTADGRAAVQQAVPIVQELQETHLAPLGGRSSERSAQFRAALLDLAAEARRDR